MGYREGHRGTGEVPPAEAGTHLQLLSPIRTLPCRSTERGGGAQVPAHAASERSRCPPPTLCISWRSMPTPGALSAGPGLLLCPAASCSGPDAQGCQATGGREERGFPGCVASLCLIFRDLVC